MSEWTFEKARDYLISLAAPVASEEMDLEHALGRVLAEDVTARADVPPFDRSPYDGYAFRAADTAGASRENPVTLTITEEIPAGGMWTIPLTEGTAAKVLTGAPVPPGADAVVKYEETEFTPEHVNVFASFRTGENIVRRGEDVQAGTPVVLRGTVADAPLLGTLAGQGVTRPLVYRKPRVGILTTGSELREPGEHLTGGAIVNSNRYTFQGAVEAAGCEAVFLGAPGDRVEDIGAGLRKGIASCDAVVTTGGVSVGDYDLTPEAMTWAGAELLLRGLDMKPGGAFACGRKEGKLLFGLSGNPASALTAYCAVVLPVLRKLAGRREPGLPMLTVKLKSGFGKKSPRTRLLRGRLSLTDGTVWMEPSEGQGNGVLHTMIGCDVLAVVPAGSGPLPAGTELSAYRIG